MFFTWIWKYSFSVISPVMSCKYSHCFFFFWFSIFQSRCYNFLYTQIVPFVFWNFKEIISLYSRWPSLFLIYRSHFERDYTERDTQITVRKSKNWSYSKKKKISTQWRLDYQINGVRKTGWWFTWGKKTLIHYNKVNFKWIKI